VGRFVGIFVDGLVTRVAVGWPIDVDETLRLLDALLAPRK
jgi:hypothetical protein